MGMKETIKEKYGEAARRVIEGKGLPADCCSKTSCCDGSAAASCDPITSNLYNEAQVGQMRGPWSCLIHPNRRQVYERQKASADTLHRQFSAVARWRKGCCGMMRGIVSRLRALEPNPVPCVRKQSRSCMKRELILPDTAQSMSINLPGNNLTTSLRFATMRAKPARCSSPARKICIAILTIRLLPRVQKSSALLCFGACGTNCAVT